ncbi:unnamed protein product [Urochloa humidicola]
MEDGAASRFLSPLDPVQTFSGGVEAKRDRAAASRGPPKSHFRRLRPCDPSPSTGLRRQRRHQHAPNIWAGARRMPAGMLAAAHDGIEHEGT